MPHVIVGADVAVGDCKGNEHDVLRQKVVAEISGGGGDLTSLLAKFSSSQKALVESVIHDMQMDGEVYMKEGMLRLL